jgi:hypothetical protein
MVDSEFAEIFGRGRYDYEAILDKVWEYLNCKTLKPKIRLARQHPTGRYNGYRHEITIREDSWHKMTEAEKRLTVIHEAIHACKVPHQRAFRTSLDPITDLVYKKIWGEDDAWKEFMRITEDKLAKIRRGEDKMEPFLCDPDDPSEECE